MSNLSQQEITEAHWPARSATAEQSAVETKTAMIRDVAVHLDGTGRDEAKLAFADGLATSFSAHLVGFCTNEIPTAPIPAGPGSEWLASEIWKAGEKAGTDVERHLRERFERLSAASELRRSDGAIDALTAAAARVARCVDLFVSGRPYGHEGHWPGILEAVLFEGSAGVLVVPPEAEGFTDPETILVGWTDTRECSRAIAAAMPFLRKARLVVLVSIAERASPEEDRQEPDADMARHLARHGASVEVRHLPNWDQTADALLNEAVQVGASLLVAGAYGRSRLREMILGGTTRRLLTKSTIPLLMAH